MGNTYRLAARRGFRPVLAFAALIATAQSAQADLTISSKPTHNVTCSAGVCTTFKASGTLNATDLANMLATSDVVVKSRSASANLVVTAPVTWVSANRLTLDAYASATVNGDIIVEGPGGLTVKTNDGGSGGEFSVVSPKSIAFWDLGSSLIIDGNAYTLVGDIATLAGDVVSAPSGRYALAKAYDASIDGTYAAAPVMTELTGAFEGLGNTISHLTISDSTANPSVGLFARLGTGGVIHDAVLSAASLTTKTQKTNGAGLLVGTSAGTIAWSHAQGRLTCSGAGTSSIGGLVGTSANTSAGVSHSYTNVVIRVSAKRTAWAGGLVGSSSSATISDSYSAGSVTETDPGYNLIAGGLAGASEFTPATITRSHSTASVTHAYDGGGLVGDNVGVITQSYATGAVSDVFSYAGGLAGVSSVIFVSIPSISDSYASGNVSAVVAAGGLAGWNLGGSISGSHAGGIVTATNAAGGLVGLNQSYNNSGGSITQSFATGEVTGNSTVAGGLVGANGAYNLAGPGGSIMQSYATGSATGGNSTQVGGLAGLNVGTISDTYATGTASGGTSSKVGGLVGGNGRDASNTGSVANSYSTGTATGGASSSVGGLLGYEYPSSGTASDAYWDTDMSGISDPSQGAGNVASEPGITAQTTTQLQSGLPSGFSSGIWGESGTVNGGLPYLLALPPP